MKTFLRVLVTVIFGDPVRHCKTGAKPATRNNRDLRINTLFRFLVMPRESGTHSLKKVRSHEFGGRCKRRSYLGTIRPLGPMSRRLSFSHSPWFLSRKLAAALRASQREYNTQVGGCAPLFARVLVPHVAGDRWGTLSSARNQLRLDELCVSRNASRSYRPINNKPRTALHVALAGSDRVNACRRRRSCCCCCWLLTVAVAYSSGRVSQFYGHSTFMH